MSSYKQEASSGDEVELHVEDYDSDDSNDKEKYNKVKRSSSYYTSSKKSKDDISAWCASLENTARIQRDFFEAMNKMMVLVKSTAEAFAEGEKARLRCLEIKAGEKGNNSKDPTDLKDFKNSNSTDPESYPQSSKSDKSNKVHDTYYPPTKREKRAGSSDRAQSSYYPPSKRERRASSIDRSQKPYYQANKSDRRNDYNNKSSSTYYQAPQPDYNDKSANHQGSKWQQGQSVATRCYRCNKVGHMSSNCPLKEFNLWFCYYCQKVTDHKGDECFQ